MNIKINNIELYELYDIMYDRILTLKELNDEVALKEYTILLPMFKKVTKLYYKELNKQEKSLMGY